MSFQCYFQCYFQTAVSIYRIVIYKKKSNIKSNIWVFSEFIIFSDKNFKMAKISNVTFSVTLKWFKYLKYK